MTAPLRVLSLGGGVQSSTLLLMACAGEVDSLDAVVFADTGGEMPETYDHLEYLEQAAQRAGIAFLRVSAGDLRRELVARHGRGGQPNLPVHLRHADGSRGRLSHYRCSYDFKRRPVTRAVKQLCGPPGAWKRASVEQWIGFSADEVGRVKPADECRCGHRRVRRATAGRSFAHIHTEDGCSRCRCQSFDPWQSNRWPLIELGLARDDCMRWLESHGHVVPRRSACWYCPNRGDKDYWGALRREHPELFDQAVELDEFLRHGINGLRSEAYLHRSARPLSEIGEESASEDDDSAEALDCEAGVCFT